MKTLFASTALVALTVAIPALAADLPAPMAPIAPEPVTVAAYSWTGVYAGVNVGYGWGDRDATDFGDEFEYDLDGVLVGGQVGANYQFGNFVLGVEGDIALANMDDSVSAFGGFLTAETELDWFATLRGRAGFAWDRFLIYGTGGVAAAGVDVDVDFAIVGDSDSQTHVGWTAGGGVEGMVTENITLGLEYLYADLGEEEYEYDLFGTVSEDADLTMHLVRGKLNVKF